MEKNVKIESFSHQTISYLFVPPESHTIRFPKPSDLPAWHFFCFKKSPSEISSDEVDEKGANSPEVSPEKSENSPESQKSEVKVEEEEEEEGEENLLKVEEIGGVERPENPVVEEELKSPKKSDSGEFPKKFSYFGQFCNKKTKFPLYSSNFSLLFLFYPFFSLRLSFFLPKIFL